ncbi:thiol-disulfide oxidoreductase DCC family protein [Epilithonimonas mollis]|uniref:Predicted thiol-disulfide oxidoreductase YuxK, DCC family n=1 Tax=Epilithonimonas mollis TaxID=216903 RepID=A0A1M6SAK9_9FLAO|nr:DCC1-like thiol-disulfide oxidoreductase family protein [Epilithonimonas mollis]SHK41716.1 Predicted thiol-disulfide oxidoreductase YuxK, DCC family [Epilithonimonas mollis]
MTTEISVSLKDKSIVFYDGECGFCNHWVQWILEKDRNDKFLFSSLQSEFGQKFLNDRNLPNQFFDTLYLWKPEHSYLSKYQAVLRIASELGGVYSLANIGKILPDFIGNQIYSLVSRNRKKLAENQCFLPNAEQRKKFLN